MKSFQFTIAEKVGDQWVEHRDLTPIVTANTPTEAMAHPEIVAFMEQHPNHRIFRTVR